MTPEPGDIVLIPFPFSDLSTSKRRPVLALTSPDRHGDFIAVGITSVAQQAGFGEKRSASRLEAFPSDLGPRTSALY